MKKIILTTLISGFIVLPVLTLAFTSGQMPATEDYDITTDITDFSPTGLLNLLKNVIKWVYTAFFIIAVLIILFAAYTYLTAGADPAKISAVHKQLVYAAIAIVIALIAIGVSTIIQGLITT